MKGVTVSRENRKKINKNSIVVHILNLLGNTEHHLKIEVLTRIACCLQFLTNRLEAQEISSYDTDSSLIQSISATHNLITSE